MKQYPTQTKAISAAKGKAKKNGWSYAVIQEGHYFIITGADNYYTGTYSQNEFVCFVDSDGSIDFCQE